MAIRLDFLRKRISPLLDRLRPVWAIVALAEAVFIFWSSSRTWDDDLPTFALDWGNFLHFPIYGSLAWWLHLALGGARPGGRSLGPALILSTAFGLLDEIHQAMVPGRDFSIYDLVTDAAGGFFFLTAFGLLIQGSFDRRKDLGKMGVALIIGLLSSFVFPGFLPDL